MDIYNEEKFNKGGVILERIHPDLQVEPYVPYYERMGYVVSIVEKPNGWVELIGEKKDTFEDAYGRFKDDIRKNMTPRKMAKGGKIIKGFNPKDFSLEEIDSKLMDKDILLNGLRKGDSTYGVMEITLENEREFVWDGRSRSSKKWKSIKDKRFTMSDYGQISMDKGSENLYFNVVIYELDGFEPMELSMYSKNNHSDLKAFANNFISKMARGGVTASSDIIDIAIYWLDENEPLQGEVYSTNSKELSKKLKSGRRDKQTILELKDILYANGQNDDTSIELEGHSVSVYGEEGVDDYIKGEDIYYAINEDKFAKGGKIKELETDEFTYYVDEDGENVEMYRNSDNSLVSDNYFAENDLYERMQEIANGREKYVYINPDSLEYLDEYKYGKGGRIYAIKGLNQKFGDKNLGGIMRYWSKKPEGTFVYAYNLEIKYPELENDKYILVEGFEDYGDDTKNAYLVINKNKNKIVDYDLWNYDKLLPIYFKKSNSKSNYAKGGRTKIENDGVDFNAEMYKGILGDKDNDGTENADDVEPNNPNISKNIEGTKFTDTFRTLLNDKRMYDDSMYSIIGEMEKMLPNKFDIIARTKTPFSILKKLVEKRLKFKRDKFGKIKNKGLTDVIGTTITTNNTSELMNLRSMIGIDEGDNGLFGEIIEVDDKFKIPQCGYRAIHYIVEYNGVPVEIQLKTKRMKMLNEFTHPFYKAKDLDCDGMGDLAEIVVMADNGSKEAQKEFTDIFADKERLRSMVSKSYARGGELSSYGLSFTKVDYDVNVNPSNLEVDVNIKESDSVDHYALNDSDAEYTQYSWGYMVYPKNEKQLYDVLKSLRVSVSKQRLSDWFKSGGKSYARGGEVEWFDYSKIDLEELPYDLDRYFIKDADTKEIDLNLLEPTRAREKGVKNANKYMRMAYDGEIDRRKPISVYERNGEMFVFDGNSTIANAKNSGWKTIYVEMIDDPNDDFERGGEVEDNQYLDSLAEKRKKMSRQQRIQRLANIHKMYADYKTEYQKNKFDDFDKKTDELLAKNNSTFFDDLSDSDIDKLERLSDKLELYARGGEIDLREYTDRYYNDASNLRGVKVYNSYSERVGYINDDEVSRDDIQRGESRIWVGSNPNSDTGRSNDVSDLYVLEDNEGNVFNIPLPFAKGGRTKDAKTLREMSSALKKGSGMHEKQSEQLMGASSSHKKQAKNLDRIADKISKGYARGGYVDLKEVARYYGMTWFQFYSLSDKKRKEFKEMYIKQKANK